MPISQTLISDAEIWLCFVCLPPGLQSAEGSVTSLDLVITFRKSSITIYVDPKRWSSEEWESLDSLLPSQTSKNIVVKEIKAIANVKIMPATARAHLLLLSQYTMHIDVVCIPQSHVLIAWVQCDGVKGRGHHRVGTCWNVVRACWGHHSWEKLKFSLELSFHWSGNSFIPEQDRVLSTPQLPVLPSDLSFPPAHMWGASYCHNQLGLDFQSLRLWAQ